MKRVEKATRKYSMNGEHSAGIAELSFSQAELKRSGIAPMVQFDVEKITEAMRFEFPYISGLSVTVRNNKLIVKFIPHKFSREVVSKFLTQFINKPANITFSGSARDGIRKTISGIGKKVSCQAVR